jgi:hypothetical protein
MHGIAYPGKGRIAYPHLFVFGVLGLHSKAYPALDRTEHWEG